MPNPTLTEMQQIAHEWIESHGGYWHEWANLARLVEECGEVAGAFQRLHGFRPRAVEVDLAAELGDLLWCLLVVSNQQGVELTAAFESTLAKVTERDGAAWQAWAAARASEPPPA